jgi:hypothetical protein
MNGLLDEQEIDEQIKARGLTAARVTPEQVDAAIASEEYQIFSGRLTICCLTLRNGFLVTGEASCVSAANFDEQLGRRIARRNAREKIWSLEGYLLKQRIYEESPERVLSIAGAARAVGPEETY